MHVLPTSLTKVAENQYPNKKMNVKMKENVPYKVPTPVNMTECQAYGSLPKKPQLTHFAHKF